MNSLKLTTALLTLCSYTFAEEILADNPPSEVTVEAKEEKEPFPWLTGPLLTPAAHVVPCGHYNIEPYLFVTTQYGHYDSHWNPHSISKFHNLIMEVPVQIGIPWHCDVTISPQWTWNHTHGASHWVLNDLFFNFERQLLYDKKGKWWPAIKLELSANFPIGRYQKLQPRAKGTDIGGTGSWQPSVSIAMSHLYWWGGHFFFTPRVNIQYTFPTAVHVKHRSIYANTREKVYPGQILNVLFGFEISLSQRWAIANDISYLHINKTRFKSTTPSLPSCEQFSLAPAIEYNWSENYGIIAGAWFSIAGRNLPEFASAVVAINVYH